MNKIFKIIGGIFAVLGLFFLLLGIIFYIKDVEFKKTAIKTTGTITEIVYDSSGESSSVVYVKFSVQGKTYEGKINYYTSSMYEGKSIVIYYDPSNPNNFQGEEASIVLLIFAILGGVFFLVGIIFILIVTLKNIKRKKVINYNYKINASIIGVTINQTAIINGRHPYVLEANCMSPTDGKLYIFKSDYLFQDVSPIIQQFNMTTIPVYVNPNNYNEYVMDIEQIKKYIGN